MQAMEKNKKEAAGRTELLRISQGGLFPCKDTPRAVLGTHALRCSNCFSQPMASLIDPGQMREKN